VHGDHEIDGLIEAVAEARERSELGLV